MIQRHPLPRPGAALDHAPTLSRPSSSAKGSRPCFPETGQWAHVNVLGVDDEDLKRVKGNIYELVPYLRSQNLVHFLNHPLQSYRMQKKPMRFVEDVLEGERDVAP